MGQMFSPESKFMQAMSRIADLVGLNLLFLVSCLPVITIGASYTALFKVVFSIGTKREGRPLKAYLRAWKENFVPATKIWLVLLFTGAALAVDAYLFSMMFGKMSIAVILILTLAVIELITASYAFPLVGLFENTMMETLKNALFIGVGSLPRTMIILVIQVLPFFLYVKLPLIFFHLGFLWVAGYFSAGTYFSGLLMRRAFAGFLPEDFFAQSED